MAGRERGLKIDPRTGAERRQYVSIHAQRSHEAYLAKQQKILDEARSLTPEERYDRWWRNRMNRMKPRLRTFAGDRHSERYELDEP